ncbi:MAG: lipocalin-like domain-containing protein [Proteobacteria bacterium]|nr:lipocalin-like domain-containing protein [Pseudomonadota bacterium]
MSVKILKKNIFYLLHIIILIAFIFLFVENANAFTLVGTWKLNAIEKQNQNKSWESDCNSPTGLITYTSSGYVSVGLNCMKSKNSQEPSFTLEDTAFYVGKYSVNKNVVTHIIQNSSAFKFYGKTLERELQILNDNSMFLIVKRQDGGLVRLKWERVANR